MRATRERAEQHRAMCVCVSSPEQLSSLSCAQSRSSASRPFFKSRQRTSRCYRAWFSPVATMTMVHVILSKTGPQDDLEAFIKLFEHAMEVWGWPNS